MPENDSFQGLMLNLRAGDQDAATEVFNRYAGRLIGLARKRLNDSTRQKVGPEDVMQSAYGSFFRRVAEGQFELTTWDEMWALLVIITLRKCVKWVERFKTQRRKASDEISLHARGDDDSGLWEVIARTPTAAEAVILTETVEQLMQNLDERERQVVMLRLQGYTVHEISAQVQASERTVQRAIAHVRKALERLCSIDPE